MKAQERIANDAKAHAREEIRQYQALLLESKNAWHVLERRRKRNGPQHDLAYDTQALRHDLSMGLTELCDRHGFNSIKADELKAIWKRGTPYKSTVELSIGMLQEKLQHALTNNESIGTEVSRLQEQMIVSEFGLREAKEDEANSGMN